MRLFPLPSSRSSRVSRIPGHKRKAKGLSAPGHSREWDNSRDAKHRRVCRTDILTLMIILESHEYPGESRLSWLRQESESHGLERAHLESHCLHILESFIIYLTNLILIFLLTFYFHHSESLDLLLGGEFPNLLESPGNRRVVLIK